MKNSKDLSLNQQQEVGVYDKRFRQAYAERPEIADEEFLVETEVSDEEYVRDLGLCKIGQALSDKVDIGGLLWIIQAGIGDRQIPLWRINGLSWQCGGLHLVVEGRGPSYR